MKKLFEYFEAASKLTTQKVIVYPGRFHPPGPHHFAAYRSLRDVASKIGAKVVVAMSGVEGDSKHPYSFNKRKKIWQKAFPDVELVKIKESDMYKPDSIVKNGKYSSFVYIVSLGDKDQQGDKPRISIGGVNKQGESKFFKQQFTIGELIKSKNNLLTADKAGYVLVTNDAVMVGDSKVSATIIREEIKKKNIKKLNQIYNKYPSVVSELLHEDVEFRYEESITHHKHIEELLYDHDIKDIIAIFKDTIDSLNPFSASKTQTKTQFKVDGSPSIIFGKDAEGFFVAYKGIAKSKEPKIFRSLEDIESKYSTAEAPHLNEVYKYALQYLPAIVKTNAAYQADILFIPTMKKTVANGIAFKPNLITYVIPADTEQYKKAVAAKIGLTVHTKLKGTAGNYSVAGVPSWTEFKPSKNVFLMSNEIKSASIAKTTIDKMVAIVNQLQKLDSNISKDIDPKTKEIIERSINACIRQDVEITTANILKNMEELVGKEKVKEDTKEKKKLGYVTGITKANKFIGLYAKVAELKNDFVDILDSIVNSIIQAQISIGGNTINKHEGYVVNQSGRIAKLVNRKIFSRLNFIK